MLTVIVRNSHWIVRIVLAAIFIPEGIKKFSAVGTPMVDVMFFGSDFIVVLVALAELTGGILILVGGLSFPGSGWLTRLAGLEFIIVMLGAIFTVHWPRWHFTPAEGFPVGGMQYQVLIFAISLWMLILGNSATKLPEGESV